MTGLRLARRRRPRRSRAAHAQGGAAARRSATSCSTTRSSRPRRCSSPPRARRFFVGKRAGRPAIRQDAINRLMIREARRGHRIVRLKCGDPFVFGRGGEEALALAAAGIPCEVVPGISSAIAAPLLAGIPVTHRGLASAFVVVSGHAEIGLRAGPALARAGQRDGRRADGAGQPRRDRQASCGAAGWAPRTPAAVLLGVVAARGGRVARHARRARTPTRAIDRRRPAGHHRGRRRRRRLPAFISAQDAGDQHSADATTARPPPVEINHGCLQTIRAPTDAPGCPSPTRPTSMQFVAMLDQVRARRDLARRMAEVPAAARHLRAAAGRRLPDAARQDSPGHPRRGAARSARGRRRAAFARVRPHLDAAERAVPLRAAARRGAGDAAPGRRRA